MSIYSKRTKPIYTDSKICAGKKKKNPLLSFRQHYFCTFAAYNKAQMDINQNYIDAVKTIKEAILRSQYRAAASVNKEQLSLYYGIGRYVSENSRKGFWGKGAIEQISSLLQKELSGLRGFRQQA